MNSPERSRKKPKRASTTRPYAIVAYLSLCLFLGLAVYMIYFQVAKSEDLLNDSRNHRQELAQEEIVRGPILASDGTVLAETRTDEAGEDQRVYPYGSLFAHTVGYAEYGGSGLEASRNNVLVNSHANIVSQIQNDLAGNRKPGDALVTTFDVGLQQAASSALGGMPGAVFVMEVETGKVLADVSAPAFDPGTVVEDWDALIASENGVFLNRALQGLYPPGSTFKITTALAYLRKFGSLDDFRYTCTGELSLGGFTIHCANGAVHGEQSFADAMANSCNCAFAHIAAEVLDRSELRDAAEALGFNDGVKTDLPSTESLFLLDSTTPPALAMQTGIGQGDTLATPMQMCMIAQAVANGGRMLVPRFVDHVENADGTTIQSEDTKAAGPVLTAQEAATIDGLLREVVTRGTATELSDLPWEIAGKTGTAQYGNEGRSHSWFIGYTNTGGRNIALCVLVEGGGDGVYPATGVARAVFQSWGGN